MIELRKARATDGPAICELVNYYARKDIMLARTPFSIYENIRDFFVAVEDGKVVGCSALHLTWHDMAEIRSLAVDESLAGRGIGRTLVEANLSEARDHNLREVYTFTYARDFFAKLGFHEVTHDTLPRKVWVDCVNCIKFNCCDEIAMIIELRK